MSFDLQLKAALVGDFDKEVQLAERRVARASTGAMGDVSDKFKAQLRQDVASSRLRNAGKLSLTWRSQVYPRGRATMTPAAMIFSKAPMIVSAFENGAEVKSPDGFWLAIPNPAVWPTRIRRRRNGPSVVSLGEARFGKLRMVFLKGRRDLALLVADVRRGRGKYGGFRKATGAAMKRGDYEEQAIFFLVPKARLPRLLKGETIRARAERNFPTDFQRAFDAHLERAGDGPLLLEGPDA